MVTIKDVAKKAGVSVCTVSYALNNIPRINSMTKEKVLAVARELNYQPNTLARNLKKGLINRIGFFHVDLFSRFVGDVLHAIQTVLYPTSYDLVGFVVNQNNSRRSFGLIRDRFLDGAIIMDHSGISPEELLVLANSGPLVLVDYNPESVLSHKNIATILIDEADIFRQLTEKLIRAGRRRFVYMAGPDHAKEGPQRYRGFLAALDSAGVPFDPSLRLIGNYDPIQAKEEVLRLWASGARPDAVVCASDSMAIGTLEALKQLGLSVPRDVAVFGFDDISEAQNTFPRLSTVSLDREALGEMSIRVLLDLLAGTSEGAVYSLPLSIVHRESCGLSEPA